MLPLPVDCQTDSVMTKFEQAWEANGTISNPNHRLIRALWMAFGNEYMYAGALKLVHDLSIFVGPQVLHALIVFLKTPNAPLWHGLAWTAAVTCSQLTMSLCLRHYFFKCYATGLRVRTSIVRAVYQQALVLSATTSTSTQENGSSSSSSSSSPGSGDQQRSMGQITNLVSVDAQRLQELPNYLHALWYSPIQIGLALFFLWRQLGPASLGGVAVILCTIPLTKTVAQCMGQRQRVLMQAKDARVNLNSEVLSNMKVVKLQAWEEPFGQRILHLRSLELAQLWRYLVGYISTMMIWSFTPLLVSVATFATYVSLGHELDVATALTSLALFAILRFPLIVFPQVINNCVEGLVAVNRIQSFLLAPQHEPVPRVDPLLDDDCDENQENDNKTGKTQPRNLMIRMDHVTATYSNPAKTNTTSAQTTKTTTTSTESSTHTNGGMDEEANGLLSTTSSVASPVLCLQKVNFVVRPGELVAVVGGVGCGKSTLLNALLGEVHTLDGTTFLQENASLAYFAQTPFILNATIRDNILFGHVQDKVIDEDLYQRAIQSCALSHDLELFPDGDLTEIGEKGLNLSGGQKARIALARAVYHQANITLIDDALAAVDAHVAQQLFTEAIAGELLTSSSSSHDKQQEPKQQRCVVLVTNALQYLRHASVDRIVVLQHGMIVEQGTFQQLSQNPTTFFAHFLRVMDETGVRVHSEPCSSIVPMDVGSTTEVNPIPITAEAERLRRWSTEQDIEQLQDDYDLGDKRGSFVSDKAGESTSEANFSTSENRTTTQPVQKLMTEETRVVGTVSWKVYRTWITAAGGWIAPVFIIVGYTLTQSASIASNWWLAYWSEHATEASQYDFLLIYCWINMTAIFFGFFRMLLVSTFFVRATRRLFEKMLTVVLHAPMSFYDTTPVGRLVNRFSKDIYTTDEKLLPTLQSYVATIFDVISTIVVISGVTPVFALCLVPMIMFYVHEQKYFMITYRELKRLDSVYRSPIHALLGETLGGVSTIRAYSAEYTLLRRITKLLDTQQHAYYLTCAAQSWLAVRLEMIGTLIITFACLSAILQHWRNGADVSFAGLAGLAISYSLQVTQSLNWSARMASDMDANMVSVERIDEYTRLDNEAASRTPRDDALEGVWPSEGAIVFRGAQLRYRPGLPLVLKGLDISIPGGSKVGVVGRTGAGKSTLMVALMRIVELSNGSIEIDGHDIRQIGLAMLRRNMAVIPQDPILFSGSVRTNLDPFDEYESAQLYATLHRVGLYTGGDSTTTKSSTSSTACIQSLDDVVSEGGLNFSVGQRQLLVISRALLQGAKIVIMDEATAAVDAETDAAIQTVIRTELVQATCITVAHRIHTIMDSDLVLVMDDGRAKEFDSPSVLMQRPNGMFRSLVQASASTQQHAKSS